MDDDKTQLHFNNLSGLRDASRASLIALTYFLDGVESTDSKAKLVADLQLKLLGWSNTGVLPIKGTEGHNLKTLQRLSAKNGDRSCLVYFFQPNLPRCCRRALAETQAAQGRRPREQRCCT